MRKSLPGSRAVLLINVMLAVAVCVLNYYYQKNGFNYLLKCRTSACFAAIGAVNLLWALWVRPPKLRIEVLVCLGLVFAMLGDRAINFNFIRGAALFAVGHVLLLAAGCTAGRWSRLDTLLSLPVIFGSVAFLLLYPYLFFSSPVIHGVCIVYAVIISLMLGKAVGNAVHWPTRFSVLFALGSLLFFFSDFMLLLHWFVGRWSWTDNACMATYYPAVTVIGLAMYARITALRDR